MITFLQLKTFYVNYDEIRFFEEVGADHIQITIKDNVFRRINIYSQDADVTEETVDVEISMPYNVNVKLTMDNFDKTRKALLTKVR